MKSAPGRIIYLRCYILSVEKKPFPKMSETPYFGSIESTSCSSGRMNVKHLEEYEHVVETYDLYTQIRFTTQHIKRERNDSRWECEVREHAPKTCVAKVGK